MKRRVKTQGTLTKRLLSFVLTLAIVLGMVPTMFTQTASAADTTMTFTGLPQGAVVSNVVDGWRTISRGESAPADKNGNAVVTVTQEPSSSTVTATISRPGYKTKYRVSFNLSDDKATASPPQGTITLDEDRVPLTLIVRQQKTNGSLLDNYDIVTSGFTVKINGETVSNTSSIYLLRGVDSTLEVIPDNDKLYETVTQTVNASNSYINVRTVDLDLIPYTVTAGTDITLAPASGNLYGGAYYYGQPVTVTAADRALEHKVLDKITLDGTEIGTTSPLNWTVSGSGTISASYKQQYGVNLSIGENGTITNNGGVDTNGDVKYITEGTSLQYTVTANKGYYVSDVKVNDATASGFTTNGKNTPESFTDTISIDGQTTISATFARATYDVDVTLMTSTNSGAVTLTPSGDDISAGELKIDETTKSASQHFTVNKSTSDNKYTLNLNGTVPVGYKLQYKFESDADWKDYNGSIELTADNSKIEMQLVLVDFSVTFVNPLATSETKSFTVENQSAVLANLMPTAVENYTARGWTTATTVTSNSTLVDEAAVKSWTSDTTVYAVYYLNAPTVTATCAQANAAGKTSATDGDINNIWFKDAVTVTAATIADAMVTVTDGAQNIMATETAQIVLDDGTTGKTDVTASAYRSFTDGGISYNYSVKEPVSYTVNRDYTAPTFGIKAGLFGTYKLKANGDKIDGDSGLARYGYVAVENSEVKDKTVEQIKAVLDGKTWNNTDLVAADDPYTSEVTISNATQEKRKLIFVRVEDRAGNVTYAPVSEIAGSGWDAVAPTISVVYTDKDGNTISTGGDDVYTNAEIYATVTIEDPSLMQIKSEDGSYDATKYEDYYSVALSGGTIAPEGAATLTTVSGKETWTRKYKITGNDMDMQLTVNAEDQFGNQATPYTSGTLFIGTAASKPSIDIDYTYTDAAGADQTRTDKNDALLHAQAITATITVTGTHFDPYAGGTDTKASVTVKDNNADVTIAWTKTADKWVGTYAIPVDANAETPHTLTVDATAQTGVQADTVTNANLVIDTKKPTITVAYDKYEYDGGANGLYNKTDSDKIVATVTIEDAYLAYVTSNNGVYNAVIKVDGVEQTITPESSTATQKIYKITMPADEGAHTIEVSTNDIAGNVESYTYDKLYNDASVPVLKQVEFKQNTLSKILNILTFGKFFNDTIDVTVKAIDALDTEAYASQLASIEVVDAEGNVRYTSVYTDSTMTFTGNEGFVKFSITAEQAAAWWNTIQVMSIRMTDRVGNEVTVPIEAYNTGLTPDQINKQSLVLYETSAPKIVSDFYTDTTNGDAVNADAVYYDTDTDTYWVKKDKKLTINISEPGAQNKESGLHDYKVELNGTKIIASAADKYTGQTDRVFADTIEQIEYSSAAWTDGSNTITVTVHDNAGNETVKNYTVYRDTVGAQVTGLKLDGTGKNLASGNFYQSDVTATVAVKDSEFSSGIQSIKAEYISSETTASCQTTDQVTYAATAGDVEATNQNTTGGENADFVFKYDDLKNTEGYLKITVVDNVGNETTFGTQGTLKAGTNGKIADVSGFDYALSVEGSIQINRLMFDDQAPAVTDFSFEDADGSGEADYICESGHRTRWYNSKNVNVSIKVQDDHTEKLASGLYNATVKVNDTIVTTINDSHALVNDSRVAVGALDLRAEKIDNETFLKFNMGDLGDTLHQGTNTIAVVLVDNAGRTTTTTEYVYLDTTAPVVNSFAFKGTNGGAYKEQIDKNLTDGDGNYAYYFDRDTIVTVNVSDDAPSAGLKEVHLTAVPAVSDSVSVAETTKVVRGGTTCSTSKLNSGSASFTIPANFKGWIYAYVIDNVNNASVSDRTNPPSWANPDGTILETPGQHEKENHLTITPGSQNYVTQLGGKRLYKGDTTVTLEVVDTYSGIRDISYSVTSAYDTGNNQKVDHQSPNDGWTINTRDKNLITKATKTLTVKNNSNDIKIVVTMWDNSGNSSTKEEIIHIDKDAPQITVSFNPADGGDDPVHNGYFKTNRTMTVTVKERNFDPSMVKIAATKNGAGFNPNGGFGAGVPSDTNGIQFYTYTMTYTYTEDADYTFAISATDKASNATSDDQVNYGSAADKTVAKKFTIDKTLPVITIDISGDRGKDNYYKGAVTITATVLEHNYDPNRYTLQFIMRDSQTGALVAVNAPRDNASGSGDVWTHRYVCSEEYIYQITGVKVIDKAGNETTTYGGSYTGGTFIVDNTDPMFKFYTGDDKTKELNQTATKDAAAPVIVVEDTNLEASNTSTYSVQLIGNLNSSKGNLTDAKGYGIDQRISSDNNRRLELRFNDFDKKEDIDDIYTLKITATDKAGRTSTASAIFSVNRFGSTYMVSEKTQALVEDYYTNEEKDVEIIQINAAEISGQEISVNRNNTATKLKRDVDYKMTYTVPGGSNGSDSGWYECKYDIGKEQFAEEGDYSVDIFSNDKAENEMNNGVSKRTINLFAKQKRRDAAKLLSEDSVAAPVSFCIDKTAPTAGNDFSKPKHQYFSGSHMVVIYADDDKMLDHVQLRVGDGLYKELQADAFSDGSAQVELTANGMEEIGGDSLYHDVKVVAVDRAGNSYESGVTLVQVTSDPIKWYMGNLPVKIATVIVILAVIGLIVVRRRRNGMTDEEAE